MSLFTRFPSSDINPFFRLLDDYTQSGFPNSSIRAFQPKFDVRELRNSYELHGELPGIQQKDVNIEFADGHTLVVKGHTEREYSAEGSQNPQGRITGDVTDQTKSHKATVEDETPEEKPTDVATIPDGAGQVGKDKAKFWVSERSVGEFHRAFSFPQRVDQDNVKATLKDGILNVVIPKAVAQQGKKIQITS